MHASIPPDLNGSETMQWRSESPEVEEVFRASTEKGGAGSENLLDLDVTSETKDEEERTQIAQLVDEIEERLGKLNKIARERNEVLKDLKEKVDECDFFLD